MVKNLPAMQEIQVQSRGWEDPLEKEMATHSSVLACRIPGAGEPDGLPSGVAQSRTRLKQLSSSSRICFKIFPPKEINWGVRINETRRPN